MQRLATPVTAVRIAWLVLPFAMGPSVGSSLDGSTRAVALTGSALAWGGWAVVLVAVLIPRTVSLTVLRIVAPAALATANWAALSGARDAPAAVGVVWAALTVVIVFSPSVGDAFVNGSSYGDERRMPLRTPGALLLGPVQLAWVAAVGPPIGAPLLLAAREWVAATVLAAIGVPATLVAIRALHGLARRWVVFVPVGLVLHDLHVLVDPVLFPRAAIRRLGPASASTSARDLTHGSPGLALEIELTEPLEIAPRRRDGSVEVEPIERLLFAPARPGAVLREAARRRFAVP